MADVIQLLPESIANQIAAGEVVQRPASVVKELLENSMDARSTRIEVIIRDAGKTSIQVIDNGIGMTARDARMCFERHATSKIHNSEDLFSIRTMGFRGEALASIASVAQVELKTRIPGDELGTLILIEGSEFKKQEPEVCSPGTSVTVKNLFFNVPARRNFLKSAPVEMKHIIDEFQHVALSCPGLAFKLYHNDLEIYNLPEGKLSRRIINLFGKNYQEQLVGCEGSMDTISIRGYIGKPGNARKTRGEQFLYVNGRYIRNNYLNHAVTKAYEKLLPPDHYPFYVLFIDLDPAQVDVNVHPTKTEVKFIDERMIYSLLHASVRQSLGTHNITPSLDFGTDINLSLQNEFGGISADRTIRDLNYERFRSDEFKNFDGWNRRMDDEQDQGTFPVDSKIFQSGQGREPTYFDTGKETSMFSGREEELPKTFQVHDRFIFAQVKSGLMIIDQVAAFQRILYEKYLNIFENQGGYSQKLLFPVRLDLNQTDFTLVNDITAEINALGFDISLLGNTTVIINGMPAGLGEMNEKELFDGLIEQFKQNQDKLKLEKKENLARALARYTSSKYQRKLQEEERQELINQLFGCSNPNYTYHGEPTYRILSIQQIEGLIKNK